ncbi:hypothetical protein ADA01nite_43150 [Aneurinibacillus danicus]|uniref:Uncharacterized protein n=1 Tax=Aneurinibacillus danicus TaxID=267746 RepID=A0A511VDA6_9BACL|nr:hypothetical protein ADA01nite_43150 [Aneurinibacillus danicus]
MDRLQQKIFEHADWVYSIPAIILTIVILQFVVDKGKVDKIVYLSQHIILWDD